ncbi:hypothetical protein NL676_023012 [Syzygium grande]|nr:hypothetical protein NL676_023012 [Syzygium grande]
MMGGRCFESQTPHFFKIILSDALQDGRLGIPKKFVRKYGSDLPDLVFLHVASGDAWEVELVRGYGGVWLRRGWPDFAKHYAIKQGAASNIVYDVNAGLKSGCWGRCCPFKGSAKSEALKRAASFQSPNPFFLTLMQPSLIHHSLNAPAKFFMEHIPGYRSGGDIDLYESNERFWSARYRFGIYSRKLQVKINSGWKIFAQDNNLKVGDVCVFELTTKVDRVSFRVVIFRADQDAIELGRSVQTKEASQLKLQTSSGEPDESEYGQAKNEEPASRDQSAGKSIKVEPAMEVFTLPKACSDSNGESTGETVSPTGGCERSMKETAKELHVLARGSLDEHRRKRMSRPTGDREQDFMDLMLNVMEGANFSDFKGQKYTRSAATYVPTPPSLAAREGLARPGWYNGREGQDPSDDEVSPHQIRPSLVEARLAGPQQGRRPWSTTAKPRKNGLSCHYCNLFFWGDRYDNGSAHMGAVAASEQPPRIGEGPTRAGHQRRQEQDRGRVRCEEVDLPPSIRQGDTALISPPVPVGLRSSLEDCAFSTGFRIPAGTHLLLNIGKIQRDERVWSNPEEFEPESLLPSFEIGMVLDEAVDMTESPGLSNLKATPLEVMLIPRLDQKIYERDE